MSEPIRVLVVDDSRADRRLVRHMLTGSGQPFLVEEADGGPSTAKAVREREFDCILLDYYLPGTDGLALLREIKRDKNSPPVILLTGLSNERLAVKLMKAGAADYISKSDVSAERLSAAVRRSVHVHRQEMEDIRAQKALRQSEERFRKVVEQAGDALLLLDERGRLADVNQAACGTLGYSRDELLACSMADIDPALGTEQLIRLLEQLRAHSPLTTEALYRRKDGKSFPVEVRAALIELNGSHLLLFSARDVSERRRTEEAARLQGSALDAAANGIIITDRAGTICSVNQALTRLTGYAAEELLGKNPRILKSTRHGPGFYRRLWETIAGGDVWQGEIINRRKDGSLYTEAMTVTPVRGERGEITHFVAIKQDISGRKRVELELRQARQAAEAATRAKSEFLANMSHEIRTPMNGVIGMAELALDTHLNNEQREYVESIQHSGKALLTIINDILDLSKIEAGKLSIERSPLDLRELVEEVAELLAPRAREKSLELAVRFLPDTARYLRGDAGRIRQVLTNLAGNAIKFTHEGYVLLEVTPEAAETDGEICLKLAVEDTGIGIPEHKIENIFETFTQADASTTRKYGGTGLGLTICKRLAGLMGGSVGVTSHDGQGSRFWFTVRMELDPAAPVEPPLAAPLEGARILVVDESTVNRRTLEEQLSYARLRSSSAVSGPEALQEMRRAHAAGDPYRLALVAQDAADMAGEDLARAMQADKDLRDTVAVLMASTPGELRHEAALREAGFSGCIAKPVRPSELLKTLAHAWLRQVEPISMGLLDLQQAVKAAKATAPEPPRLNTRVLIAEDNAVNQKVAERMLRKLSCQVDIAANGKEALQMVDRCRYDLVFMDCLMPEMDGYEATAEIRKRRGPEGRVPIVAMTANAMKGDREKCLAAGMDDYLSKPITPRGLQQVLERWVRSTQPQHSRRS